MKKSPDYPVPALEKGLDILESLAAAAIPQSLAELAAELKRSRSELFRMLNCLERRGYVIRDLVSAKYGLSLKLFTLAHGHSVSQKLLQAARRPMQRFTEEFHESCHLSVLERGRLLVLAQQESSERVRLSIEVGGEFDPAHTASGRLLLAHVDEEEYEAVVGGKRQGRKQVEEAKALSATIAEIRRTHLSTAEGETIEGVRDLAVLVGTSGSGVIAALTVTRLVRRGERENEAALLEGMRAAAGQITVALGLS